MAATCALHRVTGSVASAGNPSRALRRALTMAAVAGLLSGGAVSSALAQSVGPASRSSEAPDVLREFRGVWVATVANIDWPSQARTARRISRSGTARHPRQRGRART